MYFLTCLAVFGLYAAAAASQDVTHGVHLLEESPTDIRRCPFLVAGLMDHGDEAGRYDSFFSSVHRFDIERQLQKIAQSPRRYRAEYVRLADLVEEDFPDYAEFVRVQIQIIDFKIQHPGSWWTAGVPFEEADTAEQRKAKTLYQRETAAIDRLKPLFPRAFYPFSFMRFEGGVPVGVSFSVLDLKNRLRYRHGATISAVEKPRPHWLYEMWLDLTGRSLGTKINWEVVREDPRPDDPLFLPPPSDSVAHMGRIFRAVPTLRELQLGFFELFPADRQERFWTDGWVRERVEKLSFTSGGLGENFAAVLCRNASELRNLHYLTISRISGLELQRLFPCHFPQLGRSRSIT